MENMTLSRLREVRDMLKITQLLHLELALEAGFLTPQAVETQFDSDLHPSWDHATCWENRAISVTTCTKAPKIPPGRRGSQTGLHGSVVRGGRAPPLSPKPASQGTDYLAKHSGRCGHTVGPCAFAGCDTKGQREQPCESRAQCTGLRCGPGGGGGGEGLGHWQTAVPGGLGNSEAGLGQKGHGCEPCMLTTSCLRSLQEVCTWETTKDAQPGVQAGAQ